MALKYLSLEHIYYQTNWADAFVNVFKKLNTLDGFIDYCLLSPLQNNVFSGGTARNYDLGGGYFVPEYRPLRVFPAAVLPYVDALTYYFSLENLEEPNYLNCKFFIQNYEAFGDGTHTVSLGCDFWNRSIFFKDSFTFTSDYKKPIYYIDFNEVITNKDNIPDFLILEGIFSDSYITKDVPGDENFTYTLWLDYTYDLKDNPGFFYNDSRNLDLAGKPLDIVNGLPFKFFINNFQTEDINSLKYRIGIKAGTGEHDFERTEYFFKLKNLKLYFDKTLFPDGFIRNNLDFNFDFFADLASQFFRDSTVVNKDLAYTLWTNNGIKYLKQSDNLTPKFSTFVL
ncbi:MAG: hypothetical protein ACRC6U_07395 [Fusobacteriaceae bacterium]